MASKSPNFGGSTLTFLRDYSMSSTRTLNSDPIRLSEFGAPQGSVLVSTLFNIHINNIEVISYVHSLVIGGLQSVSRDTDNNDVMYNCWWTNKRS